MSNKSLKMQKGFTLVELAIVLVIIGLIVSSVLVGQDLIKAAQLRATTRQLTEFQVGVNTFIGKYNGVPGDLLAATATSFGLTAVGSNPADGDGTIESVPSTGAVTTYAGEIASFWSELSTSGKELISGSYTACTTACATGVGFPAMKFGSAGWGVYGASGTNYFYAGAASPSTTTATTMANPFIPIDAANIDTKIDDGLPNSGDVMAGGNTLTNFVTTLSPSATCVSTGAYVMSTTTPACGLQFKMQTF